MKKFGLLAIIAGSVLIYGMFYQGLTWSQFEQELANWTHLPFGGKEPGKDIAPAGNTNPGGGVVRG